ncbi:pentatricopeptide repeat-containing protein At5g03800 [Aristolochia californica]|uniref:pentatricopeptide repeat-containing protein At5g03800 n=1 Tax=Aristolochia californica TaxID=171875 RepID=UPI0035DFA05E
MTTNTVLSSSPLSCLPSTLSYRNCTRPPHFSLPAQLLHNRVLLQHPTVLRFEFQENDGLYHHSAEHARLLRQRCHSIGLTGAPHMRGNSLISSYIRLGAIDDARKTFDSLPSPDIVSYCSLISAYAKTNKEAEAIYLFIQMCRLGIEPNEFAIVAVLTASIRLSSIQLGVQLHGLAVKTSFLCCVYVSNAIMAMYIKCRRLLAALQLFGEISQRDAVSFNTVISGLIQNCEYCQAFDLFRDLQVNGFKADQFSTSGLLSAAAELYLPMLGEEIHAHSLRLGLVSNLSVNNALIRFYTNCGTVEDVVSIFERMSTRDVITWTEMVAAYMEFGLVEAAVRTFKQMPEKNCVSYNALLTGFCKNGDGLQALEFFCKMLEDGVELSDFTLTIAVNACAMLSAVGKSKQIHGFVVKVGLLSNSWVEAALLDMCTKCGRMDDAKKMFNGWAHECSRSIACTTMICGYAQNGQPEQAMALFCAEEELVLDDVALATVLGVCGNLGFVNKGKQLHSYALKSGLLSDLTVGNAAVSMYSKCGNLGDAVKLFELLPYRDTVSWNTLISGYLLHREGENALHVWRKMEKMSIRPDSISFVLILSACRYICKSDSVNICRRLFLSMRSCYGIEPTSEHYASMIHVLGCWDHFDEAEELINNMPSNPDASVWRALLDSCRLRSNVSLGKKAAQHLLATEPQNASMYILISNLYSASGRWHCSERVREDMKNRGLQKHPARSWTIHDNKIHSFYARDRSHSQAKDIYSGLEILILENMKVGYAPDTSFVLHEVEEYQKKDFLVYHGAKLAVTCGLLMTKPGKPVRVMKNIHLCGDCHEFLKCTSITTKREIYVRDATGFHCFTGGKCTCGDYW